MDQSSSDKKEHGGSTWPETFIDYSLPSYIEMKRAELEQKR